MKYTLESNLGDFLKHPVARDLFTKAGGYNAGKLINPLTNFMRLAAVDALLESLGRGKVMEAIIEIVNAAADIEAPDCDPANAWWREAVIYQIYPLSFTGPDGGDGLRGITSRLDYLKDLGADAIWLCPVFDSPQVDNGYDVRDYREIDKKYGTTADMEELIAEAHARDIKVILDLVFNHTSDEHEWFRSSASEPDSPYRDYYVWREGAPDKPPNNWVSFFGGSAWDYDERRGAWYLHLFAKGQPDLNWENPAVRGELCDITRFWREKGTDGFRLDVISFVSKFTEFKDGDPDIAALAGWLGFEHYFHGPRLHEFMRELREKGLGDTYAVGETPGLGREINRLMSAPSRNELSQIFCFDAMDNPGKSKFDDYEYNLYHARELMLGWMKDTGKGLWDALFWENHDNPRMVSKVTSDKSLHKPLAKLLNLWLLTLRGTPYIYQGQELGTPNTEFKSYDDIMDIEAKNTYKEALEKTGDHSAALAAVQCSSRDHARLPIDWSEADAQAAEADSVLSFTKAAIRLRRKYAALRLGRFEPTYDIMRKDVFCFYRYLDKQRLYVEMNITGAAVRAPVGPKSAEFLLGNYDDIGDSLKPYECRVWEVTA
ncbi:MAG: alpha-amylase family glycosyl hydrolase [Oscillospiraceae bacterium]|nr:alpha-amylase family glycosyl hydrolase [Oscillospiraceae bacterium]